MPEGSPHPVGQAGFLPIRFLKSLGILPGGLSSTQYLPFSSCLILGSGGPDISMAAVRGTRALVLENTRRNRPVGADTDGSSAVSVGPGVEIRQLELDHLCARRKAFDRESRIGHRFRLPGRAACQSVPRKIDLEIRSENRCRHACHAKKGSSYQAHLKILQSVKGHLAGLCTAFCPDQEIHSSSLKKNVQDYPYHSLRTTRPARPAAAVPGIAPGQLRRIPRRSGGN